MDREEALARVRAARVGRMASVTPAGRPHVVPFVFALVDAGSDVVGVAYWTVDDKPKRSTDIARIRNMRHDPAVEFVVDEFHEDWARLWWVRCSGAARVVVDEDERQRAVAALVNKYPQYEAAPPSGPVVAIDVERITGWQGSA
jgi:PPOX class probable F420-dependent enzyme